MALTHIPSDGIAQARSTTVRTHRLVERAALRSCTRSLLRELDERHDHTVGADARAAVVVRMQELRDELVEALRGDPAAIEALSVKGCGPLRV